MPTKRIYSRYTKEAVELFGKQIRLARKEKKWSEKELSERIGISRTTLRKIENGELSCAIGLVFEAAYLVGLTLFESDKQSLPSRIDSTTDKIALLPKRVKSERRVIRDDF